MPQPSTRLEPCVSPWDWTDGLVHNSRILRTSFLQTRFHKLLWESTRMPFKRRKCYSTSRKARVLVIQASVAAFLQDSLSKTFFYESLNARNQEKLIPTSYLWGIIFYVPQPRIPFFGSRVAVFTSDPSRLKYWLLRFFFYEEAMCEGNTGNGLLYAAKAVP